MPRRKGHRRLFVASNLEDDAELQMGNGEGYLQIGGVRVEPARRSQKRPGTKHDKQQAGRQEHGFQPPQRHCTNPEPVEEQSVSSEFGDELEDYLANLLDKQGEGSEDSEDEARETGFGYGKVDEIGADTFDNMFKALASAGSSHSLESSSDDEEEPPATYELVFDENGQAVVSGRQDIPVNHLFPYQMRSRAQVQQASSSPEKRKQKSVVKGAKGGKLLPGEKKLLRKQKIQAKRAARDAGSGFDVELVNETLLEFIVHERDMMVLPPCGKHGQAVTQKLCVCYGLKSTLQGSGKKKNVVVHNTARARLPDANMVEQVSKIIQQDILRQRQGSAAGAKLGPHGMAMDRHLLSRQQYPEVNPSTASKTLKRNFQAPVQFVSSGLQVAEEDGTVLVVQAPLNTVNTDANHSQDAAAPQRCVSGNSTDNHHSAAHTLKLLTLENARLDLHERTAGELNTPEQPSSNPPTDLQGTVNVSIDLLQGGSSRYTPEATPSPEAPTAEAGPSSDTTVVDNSATVPGPGLEGPITGMRDDTSSLSETSDSEYSEDEDSAANDIDQEEEDQHYGLGFGVNPMQLFMEQAFAGLGLAEQIPPGQPEPLAAQEAERDEPSEQVYQYTRTTFSLGLGCASTSHSADAVQQLTDSSSDEELLPPAQHLGFNKTKKQAKNAVRKQAKLARRRERLEADPEFRHSGSIHSSRAGNQPRVQCDMQTEPGLAREFAGFERYTQGIGSRLMMSMGWVQGEGLGRARQGRPEPLQAARRPRNLGLGAE